MTKAPYHIVLFPDGNRRWARKNGLSIFDGYWQGYRNLKRLCGWCQKSGVKILTAFGFSSENWQRPKEQINFLMEFFKKTLTDQENRENFQKEKLRVRIIGQKEKLPKSLQEIIFQVEDKTKNNKRFCLNLGVSYGGKWDIVQAVKEIAKKRIPLEKISEKLIAQYLSTAGLPDPDLIIRAGGEKRLSNFLLWQAAYSELYFSDKLWPDFSEKDFKMAIRDYRERQRRFGK